MTCCDCFDDAVFRFLRFPPRSPNMHPRLGILRGSPRGCTRAEGLFDDGGVVDTGLGGGLDCASDASGCACVEEASRPCFVEVQSGDTGESTCFAGVRTCRDGVWSICDGLVKHEPSSTLAPLVTGPDVCTPCNPRCFFTSTVPQASIERPSARWAPSTTRGAEASARMP